MCNGEGVSVMWLSKHGEEKPYAKAEEGEQQLKYQWLAAMCIINGMCGNNDYQ